MISSAVTTAEPSVSRAAKSDLSWFWNSSVSTTASGLTRVTGPVATTTSLSSDEVFWSVSTGGLLICILHLWIYHNQKLSWETMIDWKNYLKKWFLIRVKIQLWIPNCRWSCDSGVSGIGGIIIDGVTSAISFITSISNDRSFDIIWFYCCIFWSVRLNSFWRG